jgi:uncharacterized membrane protein YqiK
MPMALTETQLDWICGTVLVLIVVLAVVLAFWPERWRRPRR